MKKKLIIMCRDEAIGKMKSYLTEDASIEELLHNIIELQLTSKSNEELLAELRINIPYINVDKIED